MSELVHYKSSHPPKIHPMEITTPYLFYYDPSIALLSLGSLYGRDLLVPTTTSTTTKLPSPMLSPSFSSDEDSVYSPNTIVIQDFKLDDLFDWDGQQQVVNTIGNDTF
ncbi:hypothetical protein MUCCIDRAFT_114785 [Mucor lusitanicus CBS 277.49]|uniref:Uncharacterized protein n=1 Tax=Mucor lusitanicus CBS 277.49 TaxID=747725 RepID=A0A168I614_MUCCL|nr:hypothetical protein MUCCIDRAFT_114785 [Mucor lusitanicus CBS 277.49]